MARLRLFTFRFTLAVWVVAALGCGREASRPDARAPMLDGPAPEVGRGAAASPTPLAIPESAPLVVFIGDSIGAGLHLAEHQAFPAVLQARLASEGNAFRLINASESGRTTAGGVTALDWVLRSEPDLVVLELGGNDGLRGIELADVEKNLRAMIERARGAGARVLLLGVLLPPNYGEYALQFNALYPRLAEEYGLAYVPYFMEGVGGVPELNLADGLHPTAEGHERIASNVGAALAELLSQPSTRAQAPAPVRGKRPNVLFIFSDDHAPHAIGAYGGPLASVDPTPNIDALARQGLRFSRSFCTNSICGPSRAVILTGKHSHRNGFRQNGDRFDGSQPTFPKLLQAAGYRTALIGKWHLNSDPQGFDHWDVLPGQGNYYNPTLSNADGERRIEGHSTDVITDLALDWLGAQAGGEQPFFLMCQYKAPHRNWMPGPRNLNLYDDRALPEPPTLFDRWLDNASPARFQEMEIERHLNLTYDLFVTPKEGYDPDLEVASDRSGWNNLADMTADQRAAWERAFEGENAAFWAAGLTGAELVRWKYQRYMKNYLRCVRGVDDGVGRLLAFLDASGLADETVVIYSSDQGFYLGDHGWYDKRWMYEESLAMPLIVRWPGVTAPGTVSDALVQNLDYAETFLELAGVPVPSDMQGRSLVPLLRGESAGDWRDAIYYHYYGFPAVHMVARHYGIRTARYKLINFYQFGEWELYDLEADPDELENLYGRPEHAELARSLAARLEALRERYGDEEDVAVMPAEWQRQYRE